ncbi:nucleoside-diphosphate sugar epimerase/dehydratase [Pontibacter akesuensis]|uniref:NDP-sugar epimerase, includes UDP-GlcNAc-inverting 4,6-dehydratase FlaA1 and capsular polysaccharide biosynthesis protein EpsC n=1 Tax=Pontibacter akesuensis TaxID=388950 RepID=A0A1I7H4Z9_9BACT|nr:nucleoside-diphosphate sugar epimerase/dehydratase [Pontibacter akesuensis]GHA53422.1 polysaccharide biosynthesis protein CapD [Pontibacter akesuensis]SFU55741.1 NDP-sugar epimerase, includes UDP-GlcNAc-inverting 4,6-dehydratase FlaA1 and capsular polysaccharide biosynthesis protein EpsC [Pontibacter akesuensis]
MKILLNKSLPKWIVLLIDQLIMSWSFALSFFVIKQFEFEEIMRGHFLIYVGLFGLVSLITFYNMRVHTGLIRYSSIYDIYRIFSAVFVASLIYGALIGLWIAPMYGIDSVNIYLVLLISFFISSTLLTVVRMGAKALFIFIKRSNVGERERVLIYGANGFSIILKQALEAGGMGKFDISGFIDDNPSKTNKDIHQKRVYHTSAITKLQRKQQIDKLVVFSEDLKADNLKLFIETCVELGIKVQTVPPTEQWMSGQLSLNQMKDLKIEDLLQRPPIVIENGRISSDLRGKRVLVTGGAGSIGSEIVRQVLSYKPEIVIVCDQAESPLHELQLEMEEQFPEAKIALYIGDITNSTRMYSMFKEYQPDIVYHAAAYKHVPMMENNPCEAILTNVLGTKNLADLSMAFEVEKFVMISTDKAVNPTNIMGTSKRIAEIYIQSLNGLNQKKVNGNSHPYTQPIQTKFITTRFGNVLGSNGSVIPRFRQQIEKGGPLTVTHPDITRYFMTIPEAVQLVLEAGTMGRGGEIFIFDMGEPVKIVDLAKKMIRLAGLLPDVDIPISFTGLRPGEKLYEELLNEEEQTIPTHHSKIKISKVRVYKYDDVVSDIDELMMLNKNKDERQVVRKMKQIVPEYISKNSRFEELDLQLNN